MMAIKSFLPVIGICLACSVATVALVTVGVQGFEGETNTYGEVPENQGGFAGRLRNMMSVNVPIFYDMVKQGNSMGINVLSGLVRVEKGQEAERSGLAGPRPLSVRVFGIPVYERGTRVRPLDSPTRPEEGPGEGSVPGWATKPPTTGNDDELPVIP